MFSGLEFVLIAVLHLEGDVLGPSKVIEIFPSQDACYERAENAEDIVYRLEMDWYRTMDEEASIGSHIPPLKSVGMFCTPLNEFGKSVGTQI